MARTNLKIVQNADSLQWTDRETGTVIFTADLSKIPGYEKVKLAGSMAIAVFTYGVKQITADGAAAEVSYTGKRAKMAQRFESITNGTYGTRVQVAQIQHPDLWAAIVKLGWKTDTAENRAKFAALPAGSIGKLYNDPRIIAELPKSGDDAVDDFLPEMGDEESDDEVSDSETSDETETT